MELKEAIATAKAMSNFFRAFTKIDEFLTATGDFIRTVEGQEGKVFALQGQVDALEEKKVELELDLKQRTKDFNAEIEKKQVDIIDKAIKEARFQADKIKEESELILSKLRNEKGQLEKEVKTLLMREQAIESDVEKAVNEGAIIKGTIEAEINQLTEAKTALESEVQAIKDKFSVLVK